MAEVVVVEEDPLEAEDLAEALSGIGQVPTTADGLIR